MMPACRVVTGSTVYGFILAVFFASFLGPIKTARAHDGIQDYLSQLESMEVERAVSAAEWLVARSDPNRAALTGNIDNTTVIELLVWMSRVGEPKIFEEFSSELTRLGYGDPQFAFSFWIEDFIQVLASHEAGLLGAKLDTPEHIEAEILELPIVPLDEAGAAERDRLENELALSLTPHETRAAVGAVKNRIGAVITHVRGGGEK
jgi:hypothetical protein